MVIDRTLGTGAVTLAASGAYRTAWFESAPGVADPQTYFTKYLIDVIERGIPGYPRGLPLGPIYARTADSLARDRRPEPTERSVRHDADRFILARNAAEPVVPGGLSPGTPTASLSVTRDATPPTAPALLGTAPDGSDAVTGPATAHRRPRRRSVVLGGLGALVAASATAVGIHLADGHDPGTGDSARAPSASGDGRWSSAAPVPPVVHPHRPRRPDRFGGVEPRRQRCRRRWGGRLDPPVERGRTGTCPHPHRTHRPGELRGVQPRRENPRQRQRGPHRPALEGRSAGTSRRPHRPQRLGERRGLQPRWPTLASAAESASTVRLWNHALHVVLTGHTGGVRSVAFSPDSRILASGSDDTRILLWDVADQKQGPVRSRRCCDVVGVQPRRQHARQCQRSGFRPGVGHGHPEARCHPRRPHRPRDLRDLQPRWRNPRERQPGHDRPDVGCRHLEAHRHADRPHGRRDVRDVQPRRHGPRRRRRGRHHPLVARQSKLWAVTRL